MVRKAMHRPAVLQATGWSNSTLDRKIKQGKCPPGTRLDPDSPAVIWFEDDIERLQEAAIAAARDVDDETRARGASAIAIAESADDDALTAPIIACDASR